MSDSKKATSTPKLRPWQTPITSYALDESAPSVFISYSQFPDSEKHHEWVAILSKKLFGLGIKITSDINLNGGQTLSTFMYKGIKDSEYVICVCSSSYVEKTRDEQRRSGVRREYEFILERSNIQALKDFLIPILKDSSNEAFPRKVPDQFSDLYCHNFETEQCAKGEFATLAARILGVEQTISRIQYAKRADALSAQKMSNAFYNAAASYWLANPGSTEEEKLGRWIRSGNVFKLPDESCATFAQENSFDTRHDGKVLFSVGRWDESYAGDKEIFSLLRGNSDNE